ncbi:MAG: carbonic anhydrase [Bdellovibrionaceae bacterium]|nr:carbonic anhydrase [Bdellovibrio sp.]
MARTDILRLIAGFRKFRDKYFANEHPLYTRLTTGAGQAPKTLIIACSDSRVDPAIITSASPGELFVVRNVANLVPPYETGGRFHGVSAAIEFAVVNLAVENVIVLGHRQCGGIRALMINQATQPNGFVEQWVRIAQEARNRVLSKFSHESEDNICRHAELESIIESLHNLKTFPFVQAAIESRGLLVLGIYFDLELGQLCEYDETLGHFKNIEL